MAVKTTTRAAGVRAPRPALVVVALALFLSACDTRSLQVTGGLPFFPTDRREAPRAMMAARHSGTLTLEAGCLWLRSGRNRDLIIWPATNRAEWRGGRLVVVGPDGKALARVGDEIVMGGGEWSEDGVAAIDDRVESIIGAPVPPACRGGPYWIGQIIEGG